MGMHVQVFLTEPPLSASLLGFGGVFFVIAEVSLLLLVLLPEYLI